LICAGFPLIAPQCQLWLYPTRPPYWRKLPAVKRRRPEGYQRSDMICGAIALVPFEPELVIHAPYSCMIKSRVTLATIDAAAIDAVSASPSTTAVCGTPQPAIQRLRPGCEPVL